MLVLSMRRGETTTITAPDGSRISAVILNNDYSCQEIRLGFEAPKDYLILRDELCRRLLDTLHYTPIFRLSCSSAATQLIAADSETVAREHYQSLYLHSQDIQIQPLLDRYQHPDYLALETCWLRKRALPVAVAESAEV